LETVLRPAIRRNRREPTDSGMRCAFPPYALSGADFRHFLRDYPRARADIRRIAAERSRANLEKAPV
jgi:predicted metal-binding protein